MYKNTRDEVHHGQNGVAMTVIRASPTPLGGTNALVDLLVRPIDIVVLHVGEILRQNLDKQLDAPRNVN